MDISAGNNYMLYFVVCYGYNSVHYPFLDLVIVMRVNMRIIFLIAATLLLLFAALSPSIAAIVPIVLIIFFEAIIIRHAILSRG